VSRGRGPRPGDRGTATVEFAIVVPVLLLLVFGIIDFGRMASDHVQLTAAARAAALAAAAGAAETVASTAANNAFVGTGSGSGGAISITSYHRCPDNPEIGSVAQVTVSYTFQFVTPVAALANLGANPTMTAQAAAPCRA
jgi:Flp pilus assembly protein TadG